MIYAKFHLADLCAGVVELGRLLSVARHASALNNALVTQRAMLDTQRQTWRLAFPVLS